MLHLATVLLLTQAPTPQTPTPAPTALPAAATPFATAAQALPESTVAALLLPPMLGTGLQDLTQIAEFGHALDQLGTALTHGQVAPLGKALRNGAALGWLPGTNGVGTTLLAVVPLGTEQDELVAAVGTLPSAGGNGAVRVATIGQDKLYFALRDGRLSLACTSALATAALDRAANPGAQSLAQQPEFARSLAELRSPRLAHAFVRLPECAAMLGDAATPEAARALQTLAAAAQQAAAPCASATWRVAGSTIVREVHWPLPTTPDWLAALTPAADGIANALATVIPPTSASYGCFAFEPKRLAAGLQPLLQQFAPGLAASLAALRERMAPHGTDLDAVLAQELAGPLATVTSGEGATALVASLRSGTDTFRLLQKLLPTTGLDVQNGTCGGHQCWWIADATTGTRTTVTVVGNWLAFATDDAHAATVVQQIAEAKSNPLAAEFVRAAHAQHGTLGAIAGDAPFAQPLLALLPETLRRVPSQSLRLATGPDRLTLAQTTDAMDLLSAVHALLQTRNATAGLPTVTAATTRGAALDAAAANALTLAEQNGLNAASMAAVSGLLGHADSRIAARAAWLLGEWRSKDAMPALAQAAVQSNQPQVRLQAMNALSRIADESVLDAVVAASGDSDRRVRTIAAQTLGRLGTPLATTALLTMLDKCGRDLGQEPPTDLVAALVALHDHGDATLLLPTASAITSDQTQVGKALAFLFQELSPKLEASTEAETLVAVLDHPTALLRQYAIQRLGELRNPSAIAALEGRLAKEDRALQPLLQVSLAQIRGEKPKAEGDWIQRARTNLGAVAHIVQQRWSALPQERQQRILGITGGSLLLALLLIAWRRRNRRRAEAAAVVAMVAPSEARPSARTARPRRGRELVGAGSGEPEAH